LARVRDVAAVRRAAERKAGALWRDVVFRAFGVGVLDPLDAEDRHYQAAVERLDVELGEALAMLG
jgi:hypothetical protein